MSSSAAGCFFQANILQPKTRKPKPLFGRFPTVHAPSGYLLCLLLPQFLCTLWRRVLMPAQVAHMSVASYPYDTNLLRIASALAVAAGEPHTSCDPDMGESWWNMNRRSWMYSKNPGFFSSSINSFAAGNFLRSRSCWTGRKSGDPHCTEHAHVGWTAQAAAHCCRRPGLYARVVAENYFDRADS